MIFDQLDDSSVVLVDKVPCWIDEGLPYEKAKRYVTPLLHFFVVQTPVTSLSALSIPLKKRGWDKPWKKPQKLNRKLKGISPQLFLYWSAPSQKQMSSCISRSSLANINIQQDKLIEQAAFYDSQSNQTMSLFYHLRNALAHGRFIVFKRGGDIWLALEDVCKSRKGDSINNAQRLTARILVRHSTLHKWMQLIEKGPVEAD